MDSNSDWPSKKKLVWLYSHRAIRHDLSDTLIICNHVKNVLKKETLDMKISEKKKSEKFIKCFNKWIILVLDNIKYHYVYKHKYYFPMCEYPICNELLDEYQYIENKMKEIYTLDTCIKQELKKNTTDSTRIILEHIYTVKTYIQELLTLININFKKEDNILLPKIMANFTYSNIRSLDIKIGLRAKWYALPHLYRDILKPEYMEHIKTVLQIPTITVKTVLALHFKRYRKEYEPVIDTLLPIL